MEFTERQKTIMLDCLFAKEHESRAFLIRKLNENPNFLFEEDFGLRVSKTKAFVEEVKALRLLLGDNREVEIKKQGGVRVGSDS